MALLGFSLSTLRIVGYLMDGPLEENIATFGARTCLPVTLLAGSIFAIGNLCSYSIRLFKIFCSCGENTGAKLGKSRNNFTVGCQCMLEF